jgi:flagellin
MSSILTNNSATVALETLRNINRDLQGVQSEISTGKKVSNAKDNAAIFAISTTIESDASSFKQISDSLNLGSATVGVARSASEQIVASVQEIKDLVVSAQEENVDRSQIQTDIDERVAQITSIIDAAQFNGQNLLSGTGSISVLSSLNRAPDGSVTAASITVDRADLDGAFETALNALDVETDNASAAAALTSIETQLGTAIDAAAAFGSSQSRIENQGEFVQSLVDSLTKGVGALVDSDIEAASARLQALQVQQQLGTQALSIANQAPQQLLSLFR